MSSERYRARAFVYIISVSLFLIVAALTLLWARGYTVDPTSRAIYKRGLFLLSSTPDNAFVTINNQVHKERSNAKIKVKPGSYHLKVDKPGTKAWENDYDVEAGQAIVEEHIVLFASEPANRTLAEAVTARILSPDHHQVVLITRTATETALWTAKLNDNGDPQKVTTLPADFAQPTSFSFSNDGGRVAISSATTTMIITLGQTTPQTAPVGGRVVFAPGLNDRLIYQAGPDLLLFNLTTNSPEPLEPAVSAWAVSPSAVYAVHGDQLIRRDIRLDNRKASAVPVGLTQLTTATNADTVFGHAPTGQLYQLGDNVAEVSSNVDQFTVSGDGKTISYSSNRELFVRRGDESSQLVTRFSEPVTALAIYADGYHLLYSQHGELHAIATDGTNDQTLASVGGPWEVIDGNSLLIQNGASVSQLTVVPR